MLRACAIIAAASMGATGMQASSASGNVEIMAAVTLDFGSINSGATATMTGTIDGAEPGDHVTVVRRADLPDEIGDLEPIVSASNTVSLRVRNFDNANAIDPAPCAFIFKVTKQ